MGRSNSDGISGEVTRSGRKRPGPRPKPKRSCSFPECNRYVIAKDLCNGHYMQQRQGRALTPLRLQGDGLRALACSFDLCDRRAVQTTGLCRTHTVQYRAGKPLTPITPRIRVAPEGHRSRTSEGYVIVKKSGHPNAMKSRPGWVQEHTLVMAEHLGRPLLPHENVHHRNGVRDDNRIENLELWVRKQPAGQRVSDAVEWAREILRLYA